MNADRNLLFGILALQMDFISRDQLITAMNAWVLDKLKPLDKVLLEQQSLKPDAHALLCALVQKHLELHSNDPQQSLAALSSIGSARQVLDRIGDAEVQASLARVSVQCADDGVRTRQEPTTSFTGETARFRILRPHARGGLGEVYVAHDIELHREVALKEMQARHTGDQINRERFLLEAEITGGLEHPGIVPVYSLGHYADGRPFYAMRFIRGDNLQEAIGRFHKKANAENAENRRDENKAPSGSFPHPSKVGRFRVRLPTLPTRKDWSFQVRRNLVLIRRQSGTGRFAAPGTAPRTLPSLPPVRLHAARPKRPGPWRDFQRNCGM